MQTIYYQSNSQKNVLIPWGNYILWKLQHIRITKMFIFRNINVIKNVQCSSSSHTETQRLWHRNEAGRPPQLRDPRKTHAHGEGMVKLSMQSLSDKTLDYTPDILTLPTITIVSPWAFKTEKTFPVRTDFLFTVCQRKLACYALNANFLWN